MRPPSPFSHTRTQASTGRGMPSNSKLVCHADTGWEEDAICVLTWVGGSRMVTPLDGWGGVRVWVSPGLANVCSIARGLFHDYVRGKGGGWDGGVWPHPWGGCYCTVGRAPGINWLIDKVLWVTISSPRARCVLEELLDSTATCSASQTGASGSIGYSCWTALWASSWRWRDASLADSSLKEASSSEHV